jgi:uracil-DNA glycosylase family 4
MSAARVAISSGWAVLVSDPHPVTGEPFDSPVPPGTGWPGDPATARTPIAHSGDDVLRLAVSARDLVTLDARISVCRACPRLVSWREEVARSGRRAAFADQPYWGRPGPGFGDSRPRLLVVGLAPAANGTNRTGRMFTGDRSGDWLYAALHRAGFAAVPWSRHAGDGQQLVGARIVAAVRCAPPANKPTPAERDTCGAWLDRDLELAAPTMRVILALGSIAWDAALASARRIGAVPERPKPRFGHGARSEIVVPDRLRAGGASAVWTLLGSYHVSQQNTFTGKLTEAMLDDVLGQARALSTPGDLTL